jgi:hypothetical protein
MEFPETAKSVIRTWTILCEVFIDGEYVGRVGRFHDGTIELPVAPGPHEVQLYTGGRTYTRDVYVGAGS